MVDFKQIETLVSVVTLKAQTVLPSDTAVMTFWALSPKDHRAQGSWQPLATKPDQPVDLPE
jgi:hypothetical protein